MSSLITLPHFHILGKSVMKDILLVTFTILTCVRNPSAQLHGDTFDGNLILTPIIRNDSALARKLSRVDEAEFLGIQSYSGFITVKEQYNSNLFFWFFPINSELDKTPWIIWLQGGPGFSSMKGLFDLIGPLKIENGRVTLRNVTWSSEYSLLFVDNPVGAGFSYTSDDRGYPDNEDDVGEQLLEFLQQFLQMFPELRHAPLFLAGESYSGKYVPALGIQIHRHKNETLPINLRGMAIGNGLIDPGTMMHYSDLCEVMGLLDDHQVDRVRGLEESVVNLIDGEKMVDAANRFNETVEYIKKHSGVNIYNFNEDPYSKAFDYEEYVTRPEIRALIHVGNCPFNSNNQLVYNKMLPDIMNTTKPFVEELLEHYGLMSYSGQLDIILAYSLSKHTYDALQWSGRDKYVTSPRRRLRRFVNGDIVAYKKSGGNFVDVLVRRAGHMVPLDQPEVAKFIIDRFIEEFK